jgi:hypothetical protein
MRPPTTRRGLLAGAGALTAALAGCSTLRDDGPTPTPEPLDDLRAATVYVADGVVLSFPTFVERTDDPAAADLLVLSEDTDVSAEQVVAWLQDDRAVALVGDDPQATFLEWTDSEAFGEAFRGFSESDPPPDVVVVGADGRALETYRATWGDGPTDEKVVRALEDGLESLAETPTPTA